MLATLVNASANAVQVFALIALIVFVVLGAVELVGRNVVGFLSAAGLAFLALAVLLLG